MRHVHRLLLVGAAVVTLATPSFAAEVPIQGAKIVYHPLEKFSGVPTWVIAELKTQGCRIPQASYFNPKPHNLIRGEFVKKGQIDWAALCSKNNRSSILLFSSSKQKCTQELAIADDDSFVQHVGSNQYKFSRIINTATKSNIVRYIKREGYRSPLSDSAVEHEGITDAFAGKGSLIFYCKDGKWVELPGGD